MKSWVIVSVFCFGMSLSLNIFAQDGFPSSKKVQLKLPNNGKLKLSSASSPQNASSADPDTGYDDSPYLLTPAPDLEVRGGYVGYGNSNKRLNGGGVGVVAFLDGGYIAVVSSINMAGGQGSVFAYLESDLKLRLRMAIDPSHIVWWGFGMDLAGRATNNSAVNGYFSAQPVAYLGTMRFIKGKCVLQLFGKAGLAFYDNQTQLSNGSGGNFMRPAIGAESMVQCQSLRVMGDYQHLFTFGSGGDTDKLGLQVSMTWPIKNRFQIGGFGKVDGTRMGKTTGLDEQDPRSQGIWYHTVFTGVEARF